LRRLLALVRAEGLTAQRAVEAARRTRIPSSSPCKRCAASGRCWA
jgi:hypothetical protein